MRVVRTILGKTIVANCGEQARQHAEWLLSRVEHMAQHGLMLADGAHVGFGWVTLTLRIVDSEYLLFEPEFGAEPELRSDITRSLQIQSDQLGVVHSVGVQPMFSRHDQHLFVADEAWFASEAVLSRLREQHDDDSGWTAFEKGIKPAHALEKVRVSDLVGRKPSWLQALALPTGFIVEFTRDAISGVGAK